MAKEKSQEALAAHAEELSALADVMLDLKQHLEACLPLLEGGWLGRNTDYEEGICSILDMQPSQCRYWDATWKDDRIEFKKGVAGVWLDLVRYSEILLGVNDDAMIETFCLFFVPNNERNRITEIICLDTDALIEAVGLNQSNAEALIELRDTVPRGLNAQARLTTKDLRRIKVFSVK